MSEKNFKPAQTQTYRFEFGSDGEIRTVSFKGRLPEEEADKVLEAAGRRAYKDAGAAIRSYLERQGLEYSGFESREAVLKHGEIMEWADALLHSGACRAIGARAGNADRYYAVMDHQEWIREGCCEGCCYAVKRSVLHSPLKAWSRHHGRRFCSMNQRIKAGAFLQSGARPDYFHSAASAFQTASPSCRHSAAWTWWGF